MCQDRVDLRGSGLHQLVGGQADRAASVGHVVDLHNTNIKMSYVIKIRMPEPYKSSTVPANIELFFKGSRWRLCRV